MPRERRVVATCLPHHITQRGNARQDVFRTDSQRRAYLDLLAEHAAANRLRILSYCLMTNHVHIVALPETGGSMANSFRHAHGRFSQYWNTEQRRTGHLWQNRYYSCPVEESMAGRVISYVESNPVRAGIVERAEDFEWSSARAHVGGAAYPAILDQQWWEARWSVVEWQTFMIESIASAEDLRALREATYTGRPYGSKEFVVGLEKQLGRRLEPRPGGRPKQDGGANGHQLALWSSE
jgi:putative transposase